VVVRKITSRKKLPKIELRHVLSVTGGRIGLHY